MGTIASPIHAYSLPDSATKISQTRAVIETLGKQIEVTTVMRFNTVAEIATKLTVAARSGMLAYIINTKQLLLHDGSNWVQIYPAKPTIYSGTTIPSNTLGVDGDIYFRS